jgi:hypothetical protein
MKRRNVISGYNGSNNMSMSEKSKYNSKDERNANNGVKRRHYKAMSYNYEGVNTYCCNSNSNSSNNNYINESNHKKNKSNNYTHNKYIAFNKNAFKQPSSHKKLNNNNNNKQKLNKTQIRKSIKLIE